MRRATFLVGVFCLFLFANCTRSTGPLYRDGRIFARLDSASRYCEMYYLRITAEVEGYEPFVTPIFDFERSGAAEYMAEFNIKRDDTLNWNDYYGKKLIDLTGRELKGGRSVELTVRQPRGHSQSASVPTFRVDGNAIIGVYYAVPDTVSTGPFDLRVERIQ